MHYHIAGKVGGGKFGELTRFEHLVKESLANYRSANRLLIVGANLDGFSLVNREIRQTFPLPTFPAIWYLYMHLVTYG